tara:strand:+ start:213 stop:1703 length:1491 start_codon:yes stop_codon:yes gene_type:complete
MQVQKFYSKLIKNLNSKLFFYTHNGVNKTYIDLKELILKFFNFKKIFPKNKQNKIILISEKSFENYSFIISILISNNIWIQVNKSTPLERIKKMEKMISPDVVIMDKINSYKNIALKNFFLKKGIKFFTFNDILSFEAEDRNLDLIRNENDCAMSFFTSGSTGFPKSVYITNKNFISSLFGQLDKLYPEGKRYIFGDFHDNSFVIILNILLPCIYTQSTISPAISLKENFFFLDHIKKNKINVLITVPSNINRIKRYNKNQEIKSLKKVIMCGETFYSDILLYVNKIFPNSKIYNSYGSTELSPWVFSYKFSKKHLSLIKKKGIVPIGKEYFNVKYSINKKKELCIDGPMVAHGYSQNDLNKNKFIKRRNNWTYNTNDIAELENDLVFIKGRSDSVVKINGYRIEMLEIETQLKPNLKIKNCFVFTEKIDDYEKVIVAAIEMNFKNKKKDYLSKYFRNYLSKKLPYYMLPKRFDFYTKFPFNKNGKIDKAKIKRIN